MNKCDCIEKTRKKLKAQFGKDTELTNTTYTVSGVWFEPLRFRYKEKDKKGNLKKAYTKSFVIFNFCPLCGKKRH
jgi:hypothetical protein